MNRRPHTLFILSQNSAKTRQNYAYCESPHTVNFCKFPKQHLLEIVHVNIIPDVNKDINNNYTNMYTNKHKFSLL